MKTLLLSALAFTTGLWVATATRAECQIQLSEAQIDYAPLTRGELLSFPGNTLTSSELRIGEARDLNITLVCDRPTLMALGFSGTARDGESYRFGADGRAMLRLHDVFIDNQPVIIDSAGQRGVAMAFTPGRSLRFWQQERLATGMILRGKITVTAWVPAESSKGNERKSWELTGAFFTGGTLN